MTAVLIGIVTWNSSGVVDSCLTSIAAAADGLDYQVVVYDNASSDRSAAIARAHRGVRLIEGAENIGYSRAMNLALADPDGRYDVLIALNPDTVCPPNSLRRLCEALLSDPQVGLVVPALAYPDGSHQPSAYRFPSVAVAAAASFLPLALQRGPVGRHFGLEAARPGPDAADVDWAVGAVHVIRSSALSGRPAYNERWFMYAEDLDLGWTLESGGWRRRLHPEVVVTHVGNVSGVQAWGGARTERWLTETYDWYRLRRGRGAVRRWAVANSLGAAWCLARSKARRALGRREEPWAAELLPALRVHRRYLRPGRITPPVQPDPPR